MQAPPTATTLQGRAFWSFFLVWFNLNKNKKMTGCESFTSGLALFLICDAGRARRHGGWRFILQQFGHSDCQWALTAAVAHHSLVSVLANGKGRATLCTKITRYSLFFFSIIFFKNRIQLSCTCGCWRLCLYFIWRCRAASFRLCPPGLCGWTIGLLRRCQTL